jgi:hypothetical protein
LTRPDRVSRQTVAVTLTEAEQVELPSGSAVEPLTGALGAVVHSADFTTRLNDHEITSIRTALLSFRVIFVSATTT